MVLLFSSASHDSSTVTWVTALRHANWEALMAGRLSWQDTAVHDEKNESAHCERCRPSHYASHDRLRVTPIVTSMACVCWFDGAGLAFRGISMPWSPGIATGASAPA
jgi:hypothetical protein